MADKQDYELSDFNDEFARRILIPYDELRRKTDEKSNPIHDSEHYEESIHLVSNVTSYYDHPESSKTDLPKKHLQESSLEDDSNIKINKRVLKALNGALDQDITGRTELERYLDRHLDDSITGKMKRLIGE